MKAEFVEALEEIEREKGISKDVIFDALEAALISGYKKNFGTAQNVEVEIEKVSGEVKVYARKLVVVNVEDSLLEISIEDAKEKDRRYEIEDTVKVEITPRNFGRIAAQTAKQVVMQKIKEAEREIVFDDFINRQSEIVTGEIQRVSKNSIQINLGKTEGTLAALA